MCTAGRVRVLPAGYNLKADKGALVCLRANSLAESDAHVVHWSGDQKPWLPSAGAYTPRDALEAAALATYNRSWHTWWRTPLRIHLTGSSFYARHGRAFGHFLRGHLLSVFARLLQHGLLPESPWPHATAATTSHAARPTEQRQQQQQPPLIELSLDRRTMPPSATERLVTVFYGALLSSPPRLLRSAPRTDGEVLVLRVDEEEANSTDCRFASPVARFAAVRVGALPRAERRLQMTLLRRSLRHRRQRDLLDGEALLAALATLSRRLALSRGDELSSTFGGAQRTERFGKGAFDVAELVPEELPIHEQLLRAATSDVLMGYHGSGMTITLFLPPRSLVLDVMPFGFTYCLFAGCLSHAQQLWVHVISPRHRQTWKGHGVLTAKHNLDRSRAVNATALTRALERAWRGDMVSALNLTVRDGAKVMCVGQSLSKWLRAELPPGQELDRTPGACGRAADFEGMERNSWPKQVDGRTLWPGARHSPSALVAFVSVSSEGTRLICVFRSHTTRMLTGRIKSRPCRLHRRHS